MSEQTPTALSLTRQAIEAANQGDSDHARSLLFEAIGVDEKYERAWLWLASLSRNDGERKYCLERAYDLNENSVARSALRQLGTVEASRPPELEHLDEPPPPPLLAARPVPIWKRHRRWVIGIGVALIALLAAGSIGYVLTSTQLSTPIYIAFAGGMSGPTARYGREMADSIQMYLDVANAQGGVDGHPVKLLTFDDRDTVDGARTAAREIVKDGRVLLVIGHATSDASLAAQPIYAAAHMPAITPTATTDAITKSSPWYFSSVFDNHDEASLLAAYIRDVLGEHEATFVYGNRTYGSDFLKDFLPVYSQDGTLEQTIKINSAGSKIDQALVTPAVQEIAAEPDSGPVVLAMQPDLAKQLLIALRRAGVHRQLIGTDTLSDVSFLDSFNDQPESRSDPGYFTNGMYAAAPVMMDSLTGEGLRWYDDFGSRYGFEPTWRGVTSYDAAIAAVHVLRASNATDPGSSIHARLRGALVAFKNPDNAIAGLTGPFYFSPLGSVVRPIQMGIASQGDFNSAPVQLASFGASSGEDLQRAQAAGEIVYAGGENLIRQRIAYVGINLNDISELNQQAGTFNADFFLWLRYPGSDDAADITFVNAVDPTLSLGDPIRTDRSGALNYQLFRVIGAFKATLDFHNYPFDKQDLTIIIQNKTLPTSQIVYVDDSTLLSEPQSQRLASGVNAAASVNSIENWQATSLDFYRTSVGNTSLLGGPRAQVPATGIEYSQFVADLSIQRNLPSFLLKNLLPLALLALVTYVSLFFPASQTGARVTFGITGILTGAVLLNSATSSLPNIDYTVAIEWGFYAFIFLSGTCILLGLLGDRYYVQKKTVALRRLTIGTRIYYPLFIIVVVLIYYLTFR